jgi:predicted metalloprotease
LAADGTAYTSPELVVFDTPISTGCGDAAPGQGGSFYCPLDETIYIDGPDLSAQLQGYGVGEALALVAHEWGHHIQQQLDLVESPSVALSLNGMTTLETELQADCFAGSWLYATDAAGQLGPGMLEGDIVLVAETLGDPVDASTLDPQIQYDRQHGSGALRTWWLLQGYQIGPSACFAQSSNMAAGPPSVTDQGGEGNHFPALVFPL